MQDRGRFNALSLSVPGGRKSDAAEFRPYLCRPDEIRRRLSKNRFLSNEKFVIGQVFFPRGTSLGTSPEEIRRDRHRTLRISNKEMHFEIDVELIVHSKSLGGTFLEKSIAATLPDSSDWREDMVRVSFIREYKRRYRWSPRTAKLKSWTDEMVKMFQDDFDWNLVKSDLEKYFQHKELESLKKL